MPGSHWLLNDDTVLHRGQLPRQGRQWIDWSGPHMHLSPTLLCYNPLTNRHVIRCVLPHRWRPHCSCSLCAMDKLFSVPAMWVPLTQPLVTCVERGYARTVDWHIIQRDLQLHNVWFLWPHRHAKARPTPSLDCHTYVQHICFDNELQWVEKLKIKATALLLSAPPKSYRLNTGWLCKPDYSCWNCSIIIIL